jgi:hypothetical protein
MDYSEKDGQVIPERDESFVCWHCKANDCGNCVGVPCMCDCPDPKGAGEMVCVFKGCERRGVPAEGFDFFACRRCLKELGMLIEQKGRPI